MYCIIVNCLLTEESSGEESTLNGKRNCYAHNMCSMAVCVSDLSEKSAEAVLLTMFGVHFYKEITRGQLESAAKSLLPTNIVTSLKKADKEDYAMPLAKVFIKNGIAELKKDADLKELGREDITKVGIF